VSEEVRYSLRFCFQPNPHIVDADHMLNLAWRRPGELNLKTLRA
jgi:hypothetical protein